MYLHLHGQPVVHPAAHGGDNDIPFIWSIVLVFGGSIGNQFGGNGSGNIQVQFQEKRGGSNGMIELRFIEYLGFAILNIVVYTLMFGLLSDKSTVSVAAGLVGCAVMICMDSLYVRKILIPRLKKKIEAVKSKEEVQTKEEEKA